MKFKNIIKYFCCGALAVVASSCQDYLDQPNPNNITTENFWRSLEDCEKGLTSVYNKFKDANVYQVTAEARRSDLSWAGKGSDAPATSDIFYTHEYNDSQNEIINKWSALYTGIFRANQVIKGLEGIKADVMDDEDDMERWNLLMGQAVFFRGLFHFYLYCSYNEGNVPIVKDVPQSEADFYRPCNSRATVEAFVREDMKLAEELLPCKGDSDDWVSGEYGRVRSEAASAILGMTYLFENEPAYNDPTKLPNYAEAATYFKKIIDNGAYKLAAPDENFTTKGEFNDESILEVNYTLQVNSDYISGDQWLGTKLSYYLTDKENKGNSLVVPSYWLYRNYVTEPVDTKRDEFKVELQTDYHGDIYAYNDPNYYTETISGNKATRVYFVVRKYDEIDPVTGSDISTLYNFNKMKSGTKLFDVDDMKDNLGEYFIFQKTVDYYVDSGLPMYETLEDFVAAKKVPYLMFTGTIKQSYPPRPYKGLLISNNSPVEEQCTDSEIWIPQMEMDGDTPIVETVLSSDGEEINPRPKYYRYLSHSVRTENSVVLPTDEDMPYYGVDITVEGSTFNQVSSLFRKYTDWDVLDSVDDRLNKDSEINFRLIRLADIYLMYAECLIEGGTKDAGATAAMEYINKIRKRAGTILIGPNVGDADCTYQDDLSDKEKDLYDMGVDYQQTIRTAAQIMDHLMYVERPLELSLEGHAGRFIDLRRWNVTKERFEDLSERKFARIPVTTNVIKNNKAMMQIMYYYACDYDANDYRCDFKGYLHEFSQPAANYNNSFAYYPIPNKESITNPYVMKVIEGSESGTDDESDTESAE